MPKSPLRLVLLFALAGAAGFAVLPVAEAVATPAAETLPPSICGSSGGT